MRFKISLVLLFSFFLPPLFGEIFYIQSPEVADLKYLYRLEGKAFPINSYPVHGSDLLDAAKNLLPLKEAPRRELEELIKKLSPYDDKLFLRGSLSAAYQHRLRSSELLLDEGDVKNGLDFGRGFLSFDPFLNFAAGGGGFTGIFINSQADFRPAWTDDYTPVNNFILPADEINITFDVFTKGMISWNSKNIDIFLGRENLHFGETAGASLYPSARLPYMDGFRLYVPLGPFSMDYLLSTIPAKKAKNDVDLNVGLDNVQNGVNPYFGFTEDPYPSTIMTALHRFQWNFGPLITGFGASVIYVRSNNMFVLTDALPVLSWHNADIRPNNLSLIFDITWTIYRGLSFTGMFGFDDINADIIGVADSETPTIPAWILQLEYGIRERSFKADFLLEAGYTHYLWGNFAFRSADVWGDIPLARAIYRYAPNNTAVLLPLNSPYGPGVNWGRLVAAMELPGLKSKVSLDILLLSQIKNVNLVDTPYERDGSMDHAPHNFYLSMDMPFIYTWNSFEFKLAPALIFKNKETAFECTFGIRFKLDGTAQFSP
jgi:hypothetical protein